MALQTIRKQQLRVSNFRMCYTVYRIMIMQLHNTEWIKNRPTIDDFLKIVGNQKTAYDTNKQ